MLRADDKACGQIDLLLDRKDDTVSVFEMKYSNTEFAFSSDEAEKLARRIDAFVSDTRTRKSIIVTLVTPFGLKQNANSERVQSVITLEDLFAR